MTAVSAKRSIPRSHRRTKQGNGLPTFYLVDERSLDNKFEELTAQQLTIPTDIAVITESWLHDRIDDSVLNIPGYVIQRKDRPNRGGVVCTYVFQEEV